ncbi:hypothetical protein ACR782_08990 [Sphingobacterium spiritivorum]|uniref:hypothetical protein n=1 Tax=Sphingobacterium spiritivorum TaxID=258 RepID=UPI003DA411FF
MAKGTKDLTQAEIRTNLKKDDSLLLINSETKEVQQLQIKDLPCCVSPDEEDITLIDRSGENVLQFKNRSASQGLGFKILRTDPLTSRMSKTTLDVTKYPTLKGDLTLTIDGVSRQLNLTPGNQRLVKFKVNSGASYNENINVNVRYLGRTKELKIPITTVENTAAKVAAKIVNAISLNPFSNQKFEIDPAYADTIIMTAYEKLAPAWTDEYISNGAGTTFSKNVITEGESPDSKKRILKKKINKAQSISKRVVYKN